MSDMQLSGGPESIESSTAVRAWHIARLAGMSQARFLPSVRQLQQALQAEFLAADAAQLLRALQDMHHAVDDLRRDTRPAGWLGWLSPRRGGRAHLRTECREALATRPAVAAQALKLGHGHRPRAGDTARHLDELRATADQLAVAVMETQGLLAELWDGLRPQRPDPAAPGSLDRLRALLAEVDGQRARVQRLENAAAGAQDVVRLGRAVLRGREDTLALLDAGFDRAWQDWEDCVAPLARGLETAPQALAPAREALLHRLDQARGACTRLQIDEQALGQALAQLREQLASLP